jgi:hypothetical protein
MREAEVPALLLKGPVISRWLYDETEERPYGDADLLVAPDMVVAAERVLQTLGYTLKDPAGELELISGPHAQTWFRAADGALVDLHHTLPGDVLAERLVWPLLWKRSQTMELAGTDVRVLDAPSRALMVALHAAHHGPGGVVPLEDLRRAAERVSASTWAEAADLAAAIVALPKFAEGLALVPEGEHVAQRLRLAPAGLLEALGSTELASGFERFAAARGARERLRLLLNELFPSVEFMRWWSPWASRSRAGLTAAYVYRLGWIAVRAPRGWRAWRRARADTPS